MKAYWLVESAKDGPHRSIGDGQRVVLTVARMVAAEQYKGHDEILRAMPRVLMQVPNVTYVIVGEGDDRSGLKPSPKVQASGATLSLPAPRPIPSW